MTSVLATTYRPKTLAEVVAQPHVTTLLRAIAASGEAPPALLFSGPRGTGKTSCARIYAAALNCGVVANDSCAECFSCLAVATGTAATVIEMDAASHGGVADIHRLRDLCVYAVPGMWRVVIIDEAQSLSREANNALLKLLEEPPSQTTLVLVTTEPGKILPTVRSRALHLEFRALPIQAIAHRLWDIAQQEGLAVDPTLCALLAARSRGHMREALMLMDQCRLAGLGTPEEFMAVFEVPDPSAQIVECLVSGSVAEALRHVEQFLAASADIPLLASRLIDLVTSLLAAIAGDETEGPHIRSLAARTDRKALYQAMRVLWEFSDKDVLRTPPVTQARLLVARLGSVLDASVG